MVVGSRRNSEIIGALLASVGQYPAAHVPCRFTDTYLNRLPVHMATLTDGDEIQIGKLRPIFHAGRPGGDS